MWCSLSLLLDIPVLRMQTLSLAREHDLQRKLADAVDGKAPLEEKFETLQRWFLSTCDLLLHSTLPFPVEFSPYLLSFAALPTTTSRRDFEGKKLLASSLQEQLEKQLKELEIHRAHALVQPDVTVLRDEIERLQAELQLLQAGPSGSPPTAGSTAGIRAADPELAGHHFEPRDHGTAGDLKAHEAPPPPLPPHGHAGDNLEVAGTVTAVPSDSAAATTTVLTVAAPDESDPGLGSDPGL